MATKISDASKIKSLASGEALSFPIVRLYSIRTAVSNINAIRGNQSLSTKVDREARTISVTCK